MTRNELHRASLLHNHIKALLEQERAEAAEEAARKKEQDRVDLAEYKAREKARRRQSMAFRVQEGNRHAKVC